METPGSSVQRGGVGGKFTGASEMNFKHLPNDSFLSLWTCSMARSHLPNAFWEKGGILETKKKPPNKPFWTFSSHCGSGCDHISSWHSGLSTDQHFSKPREYLNQRNDYIIRRASSLWKGPGSVRDLQTHRPQIKQKPRETQPRCWGPGFGHESGLQASPRSR